MSEQGSQNSNETVIQIRRCACVVKGGRRFSFSALVVVGDGSGGVGYGYGKGSEVPAAVEKAVRRAQRSMVKVTRGSDGTIPHASIGRYGASTVMIMPANPGTGIIGGACVRSIAQAVGLTDMLSKCRGSRNPLNVVKAAFDALVRLRSRAELAEIRKVSTQ